MVRLLLLLGLVLLAVLWWRGRGTRRSGTGGDAAARSSAAGPGRAEMLRCARCGLHLPRDEVLAGDDGQPYCCAEHRRQGPAA